MFSSLKETVLKLNSDVSNVANQEKAKQLRKKLLIWGGSLLGGGLVGVLVCFILFAVLGVSTVANFDGGFPVLILIPFFLIIPFAIVMACGGVILKIGLSILIVGVTTKFVDNSLNQKCSCGNMLSKNDKFCPNCGRPIKRVCPKCNFENDSASQYCSNCGEKLD